MNGRTPAPWIGWFAPALALVAWHLPAAVEATRGAPGLRACRPRDPAARAAHAGRRSGGRLHVEPEGDAGARAGAGRERLASLPQQELVAEHHVAEGAGGRLDVHRRRRGASQQEVHLVAGEVGAGEGLSLDLVRLEPVGDAGDWLAHLVWSGRSPVNVVIKPDGGSIRGGG